MLSRWTLSMDCSAWCINCPRVGLDSSEGVGGRGKVDKSKEAAISYKALVSTVRREGFIPNEIKNH